MMKIKFLLSIIMFFLVFSQIQATELVDNRYNVVVVKSNGFFREVVYFVPNNRFFLSGAVLVFDETTPGLTLVLNGRTPNEKVPSGCRTVHRFVPH